MRPGRPRRWIGNLPDRSGGARRARRSGPAEGWAPDSFLGRIPINAAEFGESAYIIGFPLLGTLRSVNITSGIVSSLAGYKGYDGWLQTSAAAQPGNSGGPMPDEGGMVIGVIVSKLESLDAENISWAVKNEVTIAFARSAAAQIRLSSAIARLETRQLARNAAKYTVALICLQ
jgi:S1-C subfamily serine protease